MPKTCSVCGGTYEPLQAGMKYFHACAPVVDTITVSRAGTLMTVTADKVLTTDTEVLRTYKERPNKVDENVPTTKG